MIRTDGARTIAHPPAADPNAYTIIRDYVLDVIENEFPAVALDLRDGVDVDIVRDQALDVLDGEEYGRLCGLLAAIPDAADFS